MTRKKMRPAELAGFFVLASAIKLLLLPAYHSTDFEVHRHWMALSSSLPLARWYTDTTSEWTLDYPPLFAWFERVLALGAPLFDRGMLALSSQPYASAGTVAYQRLSVVATDALLLVGAQAMASADLLPRRATRASSGGAAPTAPAAAADGSSTALPVVLTFCNAGLLLVDHVHFQYNGMLIGGLLLSCALTSRGRARGAALVFSVLLNLKHLFLFVAPLFFVHLLRGYVLRAGAAGSAGSAGSASASIAALRRLAVLGAIVVGVFAASLGPFALHGQLGQLASRLFPFGRGLTHAYWAPNAWAIYTAADRLGGALQRRLRPAAAAAAAAAAGGASVASASSGLVGEAAMACLPSVGGGAAVLLVLLLQAPVLAGTWARPAASAFAPAAAFCGLAAFVFGYHVHEKALLPPLLLLSSLSPPPHAAAARTHARLLLVLSSAGHYALLPLLHQPAEWALSRLAPLAYFVAALAALRARLPGGVGLRGWEAAYLAGFVPLELFVSFAHPLLLAPRMPFLPLLATSVYCAAGVLDATALCWQLWRGYQRAAEAGGWEQAARLG